MKKGGKNICGGAFHKRPACGMMGLLRMGRLSGKRNTL